MPLYRKSTATSQQISHNNKTLTIPSIAANANYSGEILLSKVFMLLIANSVANIWLRMYLNSTYQNQDLSRLITVDPSSNSGLIFEAIFNSSIQTINCNPVITGYSTTGIYPLSIKNLSSNTLINSAINFEYLSLE